MECLWNDALKLGMPQIDSEHEEIYRLLNELGKDMKKCARGKSKVNKLLDTLEPYSRQHFEVEDDHIVRNQELSRTRKIGYAEFLRKITRVRELFNMGSYSQARLIHEDMCTWMQSHIRNVDKQLLKNILRV